MLVLFIHLEYSYESFNKIVSFVHSILIFFSHCYKKASRCTEASGFRTKLPTDGLMTCASEVRTPISVQDQSPAEQLREL